MVQTYQGYFLEGQFISQELTAIPDNYVQYVFPLAYRAQNLGGTGHDHEKKADTNFISVRLPAFQRF